jgi:hypothetical protein
MDAAHDKLAGCRRKAPERVVTAIVGRVRAIVITPLLLTLNITRKAGPESPAKSAHPDK